MLGCHFDRSAPVGGEMHPDAEAVHAAVNRLPRDAGYLVTTHALGGNRPEAMAGADPKAFKVLPASRAVRATHNRYILS